MAERFRVAVLDDYQRVAEGMADWSRLPPDASVSYFHEPLGDQTELVRALEPFDAVVAMRERTRFPRAVLARLPRLRLLVTTGMRNAAIDVAAARERGVVVCGTRLELSSTAELTWALILGLVRGVVDDDRAMRAGRWQERVAGDLHGETLGVLGLGRLGSRVAAVGQAFGMEVLAWSPHLTRERAAEHSVRLGTRAELFASARVVTIHMVLGDGTAGLVGERDLRSMRPDAYLVNTSRAGLVDEAALRSALEQGWIAGAGLDVFDVEPLPGDHWLRRSPRTLLSPHMGYVSERNYELCYGDACEAIVAYLSGTPIREL